MIFSFQELVPRITRTLESLGEVIGSVLKENQTFLIEDDILGECLFLVKTFQLNMINELLKSTKFTISMFSIFSQELS